MDAVRLDNRNAAVLRIRTLFRCPDPKGVLKPVSNYFDYYNRDGRPVIDQNKTLFVKNGASGFSDIVMPLMVACLSVRATLGRVLARWLNDTTDPERVCDSGPLTGTVGATIQTSLPLDDTIVVQKKSITKGRSYNSKWGFSPIDGSFVGQAGPPILPEDEVNAAGLAAFIALRDVLILPISDGMGGLLTPCVVAGKLSQIRYSPTRIWLSRLDEAVGGNPGENLLIDQILGSSKRRRQRRVGTTA